LDFQKTYSGAMQPGQFPQMGFILGFLCDMHYCKIAKLLLSRLNMIWWNIPSIV